jgi:hypothetical protein
MSGFVGDVFPSKLGGGIPGGMPTGGLIGGGSGSRFSGSGMEGGGERELQRASLRRVLGFTLFPGQNQSSQLAITPFRRYFNAGDTAGTVNSVTSSLLGRPPNQVGSNSMVSRLHTNYGGVKSDGEAFFTGNPKYVYDSSNYVRFKKLQAVNRNYNDSSNGGENGTTIKQALTRVRR